MTAYMQIFSLWRVYFVCAIQDLCGWAGEDMAVVSSSRAQGGQAQGWPQGGGGEGERHARDGERQAKARRVMLQ